MNILLLEDDIILQEIIEEYLIELEYSVTSFYDGEQALDAISKGSFDLLLLDVQVPQISGFEILSYLRDIGNTTPAIYITSLDSIDDLKRGFDIGADDYLKKPFDLQELQARIERVVKSYQLSDEILFDAISFNPRLHKLSMGDEEITIRQKESDILAYFIRHQNKIVSSSELIENIWNDENEPTQATIRTYIKNIRKLLQKEYIDTIKGEGYRFNIL